LWVWEGFVPEFLQTCPKCFCTKFACKFSPTKIVKTFFGVTSKKGSSSVLRQTLGAIFGVKKCWAPFSRFSGISPRFSKSYKLFGVHLHHVQHRLLRHWLGSPHAWTSSLKYTICCISYIIFIKK